MTSVKNTGVIVAAGQAVTVNTTGFAGIGFQLTGVWAATLQFKGSVDGVVFDMMSVFPTDSTTGVTSTTSNGAWQAGAALKAVQVFCSAYTSGYVVVSMTVSESAPRGAGGGGGGTPALPFTSVQFNNSGAFGGSADFTWDGTHAFVGGSQLITFTDLATPPPVTSLGAFATPYAKLLLGDPVNGSAEPYNYSGQFGIYSDTFAYMQMVTAANTINELDIYTSGGTLAAPTTSFVNDPIYSQTYLGYTSSNGYVIAGEMTTYVLDVDATRIAGRYQFDVSRMDFDTHGHSQLVIDGSGFTRIGHFKGSNSAITTYTDSTLTIEDVTGTTTHYIRNGAAQSSTHLTEWQNASKVALAFVGSTGAFTAPDFTWTGTKTANFVLAGPTSGAAAAPAFRALVAADIPAGAYGGVTSLAGTSNQITASAATGAVTLSITTNPTIPGHITTEGVTATGATGTGKFVFDGTPTLVTPVLGVASGTSLALASGSASSPSITFGSATSGIYQFTANEVTISTSGARNFAFNSTSLYLTANNSALILGVSTDLLLQRAGAGTLQLGGDSNGAAVSQTIQAANGITGTDRTGGDTTINSGKGTGAGAVSSIKLGTPTVLASGTTAQSITTRLTLSEAGAVFAGKITLLGGATFLTTSSALTDGAAAQLGTLATAPTAGNPTKWIGINDNGTTRYIPAW